jgi:hypothetical protein
VTLGREYLVYAVQAAPVSLKSSDFVEESFTLFFWLIYDILSRESILGTVGDVEAHFLIYMPDDSS